MSSQPTSNPSQSNPSTGPGGSQPGGGSSSNVNKDDPQRGRDTGDKERHQQNNQDRKNEPGRNPGPGGGSSTQR
jgi:hypothetical protein